MDLITELTGSHLLIGLGLIGYLLIDRSARAKFFVIAAFIILGLYKLGNQKLEYENKNNHHWKERDLENNYRLKERELENGFRLKERELIDNLEVTIKEGGK